MATVVQMAYSALVININTRYLQYLSLSVLINKPPTESGSREMDRQLHDSSFICFKKTSNTIGDDIEFERSNRAQETRSSFKYYAKKHGTSQIYKVLILENTIKKSSKVCVSHAFGES
jgi:hypothetical protein